MEKASAALGVPSDRLNFEVLDQGSTGFLSIGARDARILVEYSESQTDLPLPGGEEEDRSLEYAGESGVEPPVEDVPQEATQVPPAQIVEEDDDMVAEEAPEDLILAVDEFATALIDAMGLDALSTPTTQEYDRRRRGYEGDRSLYRQKGETIDAIHTC